MAKEDKERKSPILMIQKGYQGSYFDYLGHFSVKNTLFIENLK